MIPKEQDVEPRYDQLSIRELKKKNSFYQVLSPYPEDNGLWIHQDAWFHLGDFEEQTSIDYIFKKEGNGVYVFVIEGVFKVKSELIKNIRKGGTLIVPNNEKFLKRWIKMAKGISVVPVPKNFIAVNEKVSRTKKIMTFDIVLSSQVYKKSTAVCVTSSLIGKHNIQNILFCYECLRVLGESNARMLKVLKNISKSISRQRIIEWKNKSTLIDDTYNANPESVKRSIDVLSGFPGRKIFIFGDMFELGRYRRKHHKDIGTYANKLNIDILITFGELSSLASNGFQKKSFNFCNEKKLKEFIANFIKKNDIVLIKGSRGMQMERFI